MTNPITLVRSDDIDEIMRIETACFAPGIRESRDVFIDRISAFPDGCVLLLPKSERSYRANAYRPGELRPCAGYLCSEIWHSVPPPMPASWELGHSAKERHTVDGEILYISSFAVDPAFRGNGIGRFFFQESIARICWANPRIKRIAFIVNETWLGARHIYEGENFVYTGKLKGFFTAENPDENPTNALIMEKIL